jgi:hypothetical protein
VNESVHSTKKSKTEVKGRPGETLEISSSLHLTNSQNADLALDSIAESIDWLHRLSNSIRSASILGQNERAEKLPLNEDDDPKGPDRTPQWIEFYCAMIKREFPGIEDIVRKRLARGIVSRHKRIKYRLSRQERWKLEQEKQSLSVSKIIRMPQDMTETKSPSDHKLGSGNVPERNMVKMRASAPSQLTATTLQPHILQKSRSASRISSALTKPLSKESRFLIPPPPSNAQNDSDFVCPYCCNIRPKIDAIDPNKW